MSVLDFEQIAPTFFLGLGGSGAKVVDRVAHKLLSNEHWARYRDLIHFVAIDTNINDLNRHRNIPRENCYLISDFDKRSYIRRKRGQEELEQDDFVTSWVHDWYDFREEQGAGAGQIRIEARLAMFYNLEDDRARMVKKLHDILQVMTGPDNPWRDQKNRVVRVFTYGSIAGGTGSGGFLTTAYLMRDIVEEAGWGRIQSIGTLLMPSLFTSDVENVLHSDINANSYAALKELEHLMKLGYEGYAKQRRFHYNPLRRDRRHVHARPFAQVYLVDKPAEMSVDQYIEAISDSAYLQLFSPILGQQEGEADNIVKRQKALAAGHFSTHYGSYGCSVLLLPRGDLVDYAAMRYVERALDKYLVLGRDEQFRVPYGDKKFQRLSDEEKNKIIDDKFVRYVDHYAGKEEQEGFKGPYTSIRELMAPDGSELMELFRRTLSDHYDKLDQLIDITPLDPYAINEQSTSFDRPLNDLRRDAAESEKRVDGFLDDLTINLRSDRFWGDFFRRNKVQPLAQRYLLIKMMELERLSPFEDPEDAEALYESPENERDIDKDPVRKELDDLQKQLRAAVKPTFLERLKRENVSFERKKSLALQWFSDANDAYRWSMKRSFWQRYIQELRRSVEARLDSFRNVAEISGEIAERVREEAKRFMADPASREEGGESTEYYLDVELLMDDRAGRRLWDRFFAEKLDKDAYFAPEKIFQIITNAFQPGEDEDGHLVAKDAAAIARDIRAGLMATGQETFRTAIEELNLDMEEALRLEASYVLGGDAGATDRWGETPAVAPARLRDYAKSKVQFAMSKAVVLAHIDKRKMDDPSVTPGKPFYACVAARYRGEEPEKLGTIISEADAGVRLLEDWSAPDMIVFYRGIYGVPLYFYRRVNEELYEDYKKIAPLGSQRGYPLHIDKVWEDELANLDPKEAKEAADKERRETEARERAAAESNRLRDFSLCTMFGQIARDAEGYASVRGETRAPLGSTRSAAYAAFHRLPPPIRDAFVEQALRTLEERTSYASEKRKFREALARHVEQLNDVMFQAHAEEQEREVAFLTRELEVVKALDEELAGG